MPEPIGRTITREQINALPLWSYTGPTIMIEDQEAARRAAIHLAAADAIGIDTETRPAFKKGERHPVALLQLAIDDVVFLLRLNQHGLFRHIAEILLKKSEEMGEAGGAAHVSIENLGQRKAAFAAGARPSLHPRAMSFASAPSSDPERF